MKKFLILGIIVVLAALELFYFRFHTYLQRNEVSEAMPSASPGAPAAAQPKTIVQGTFTEIDFVHKGSGTAKIIEQGGKRYLRFENFKVTNGPDLYVYLSESKTPGNTLKSLDKYISLGRLKGNVGDQNYEIPEPFRGYDTAVIWCLEFGVLFSYAIMR